MKKQVKYLILGLITVFAALPVYGTRPAAGPGETLLGLYYERDGVVFQVESGGCTHKQYFKIEAMETSPATYTLHKVIEDTCETVRPIFYGTVVKFTYEEMGIPRGQKFMIGNPLKKVMTAH